MSTCILMYDDVCVVFFGKGALQNPFFEVRFSRSCEKRGTAEGPDMDPEYPPTTGTCVKPKMSNVF